MLYSTACTARYQRIDVHLQMQRLQVLQTTLDTFHIGLFGPVNIVKNHSRSRCIVDGAGGDHKGVLGTSKLHGGNGGDCTTTTQGEVIYLLIKLHINTYTSNRQSFKHQTDGGFLAVQTTCRHSASTVGCRILIHQSYQSI